jgi:hypothetical protein
MMLITAAQVATRLGVTFTEAQITQAEQAIEMASGVIADYCNLVSLVRVEDDEVALRGSYSYELALPLGPVVDVSAVTVDGYAVADFDVVRDSLIRTDVCNDPPFRHPRTPHWGGTDALVEVTYTHGFASVPISAQSACLDMVTQSMSNPTGVRRTSIDQYEVDWGSAASASTLSPDQMRSLRRFHRSAYSANTS